MPATPRQPPQEAASSRKLTYRAAFATLLDKLMKEGVNAIDARGAKAAVWSNAALAARYDHVRPTGGEAQTSPNMIANWRKSRFLPQNVEPLIVAIYGDPAGDVIGADQLRRSYRDAIAEKLGKDAAKVRRATGKPFKVIDDQAVLDQRPRPTDLSRAKDKQHLQLQKAVRSQSAALAQQLDGETENEVRDTAAGLADIAALEPRALVGRLYDLYVLATRLGGFLKSDNLKRNDFGRNVPPLPAYAAGALTALVQIAFAWALGFPTVAKLDARAAKLETPATAEDARTLFNAARDQDAIRATDAETLRGLADAAGHDTIPGRKAEALTTRFGADLTAVFAETLARAALGDKEALRLAQKASDALLEASEAADRLGGSELAAGAAKIGAENVIESAGVRSPLRVFLSYAHADRAWMEFVQSFLHPLVRRGRIELWVDTDLHGGDLWERKIRENLATCDIFVLLVSRYSLDSGYIERIEVPAIDARIAQGEPVRFYGVIVSPPTSALAPLGKRFQLRPEDARPLSLMPKPVREYEMAKIADEISGFTRSIPEDLEKKATELILDGVPLPLSWKMHIRGLDLSFAKIPDINILTGLNNLTYLNLAHAEIGGQESFPDLPALSYLSLEHANLAEANQLSKYYMLKNLNLNAVTISNSTFLDFLPNITHLTLANNQISNMDSIRKLEKLEVLDLTATQVSDISFLRNLKHLSEISLTATKVTNFDIISELTSLKKLYLVDTEFYDSSLLLKLKNLSTLFLNRTKISDISFLRNMQKIKELSISQTNTSDFSPLLTLVFVEELDLSWTDIKNANILSSLGTIRNLNLFGTKIGDVSPLAQLQNLRELDLTKTPVKDLTPLAPLIANGLKIRGKRIRKSTGSSYRIRAPR